MPLLTICAAFFVKYIPFYKRSVDTSNHGRYENLDGLRGFLAFGVFFQHAITSFSYFSTGIWKITDVRFYRHLGGESVILFFIITSFLYWSKAIAKKGNVDIAELYRSRFLRLAPMNLFSVAIVTVAALIETRFKIDSLKTVILETLSWLTLGLQTTLNVNGDNIIHINAGIHWTLHFEWMFYLLLPIAALALRSKELRLMTIPLMIFVLVSPEKGYWMIFLFGIVAAHIVNRFPTWKLASHRLMTVTPIFGLVLVYLISYKPYSPIQYVITLGIFLCFLYGNDLFGLLKTKAAKFLGTISYSIYLMHGIMLYAVLNTANIFKPITETTPLAYWTLILVAGLLTIICSMISYRYVEYPFLMMIKNKKTTKIDIVEEVM